jgi:hypothetical protein
MLQLITTMPNAANGWVTTHASRSCGGNGSGYMNHINRMLRLLPCALHVAQPCGSEQMSRMLRGILLSWLEIVRCHRNIKINYKKEH